MSTMPSASSSRSASPVSKESLTPQFASTGKENQTKTALSPSSSQSVSAVSESDSVSQSPSISMEYSTSTASSPFSSRSASPTLVGDTELHIRFGSEKLKGGDEQTEVIRNQAATIERLQEERDYYQEQCRTEKQSCQSKKDEIYQLTSDSNRQTKKFKALETELTNLKRMIKDRDLKITELEDKVKRQADEKDYLDQTISELQEDLEIKDREAAFLQNELLNEPMNVCTAEWDVSLVKKAEELQAALAMSHQEIDQLKSQLDASVATRQDGESSDDAEMNADLLEKIEELEIALLESQQEHDKLKSQLEAKDAEYCNIEQQLADTRMSQKKAEMEAECMNEEIRGLFEQVERREEYIVESAKADLEERQQLHKENLSLRTEIYARNELEKKSTNTSCQAIDIQGSREWQCVANSDVDSDAYYKGDLQNVSVFITIKPDNRKDWGLIQRIRLMNPSKLDIDGPSDLVGELAEGMEQIEKIYKEQVNMAAHWETVALELNERLLEECSRPSCTLNAHRGIEDDLEAMRKKLEMQDQLLTAWGEKDSTVEKNQGTMVEL